MEEYVVYRYDKSSAQLLNLRNKEKTYIFRKYVLDDKEQCYKTFFFAVVAKGKQKILCVESNIGELIHYSFVIPRCAKFSFMEKDDVCIGPCWTHENYRGKGIYGSVLNYISNTIIQKNPLSNCYVLIREANISSTEGIKKANFISVGKIKKTKYLKHYKQIVWLDQ